MWRKFTMPVTQLTHARHRNIYQMCGTTWNATGSEERVTCFTQNSGLPTDRQTGKPATERAPPNNNVKYVRRFAIHTQKWMRQQQERQQPHQAAHLKRSTCHWTVHSSHHRICNRKRHAGEHNNTLSEGKREKECQTRRLESYSAYRSHKGKGRLTK